MSYYKEKRQAYAYIDQQVKEHTPIEIIYFKVETLFGFSRKMVDMRIESLKQLTIHKQDDQENLKKNVF